MDEARSSRHRYRPEVRIVSSSDIDVFDTCHRSPVAFRVTARRRGSVRARKTMNRLNTILLATFLSTAAWSSLAARAPCTPHGGSVPAGANTTHSSGPFFVQLAGLDLRTTPPTRDPHNPAYPHATELPDGSLPSPEVDGN